MIDHASLKVVGSFPAENNSWGPTIHQALVMKKEHTEAWKG